MSTIEIQSNECVICRRDKNLWPNNIIPGPKRYKNPPTTPELESCLLQLLHVDSADISQVQNEYEMLNPVKRPKKTETNFKQLISSAYCSVCSKRNQDIFNLITEIYQLNLKLGELREIVKADFENSFHRDTLRSQTDGSSSSFSSQQMQRRNKAVRFVIAKTIGMNVVLEPEAPEVASCVDSDYGDKVDGMQSLGMDSDSEIPEEEDGLQKFDCDMIVQSNEKSNPELETKPDLEELKKLWNLKEVYIKVQPLPSGILSGGSIDVNLLETNLRQQPTCLSKLKPSAAPMIIGFLDEVIMSPAYTPEDSEQHSSEDELFEDEDSSEGLSSGPKNQTRRPMKRTVGEQKKLKNQKKIDKPLIRCPVEGCPRRVPFRTQDDLDTHRKQIHEGVAKPFKCPTCEKSFVDAATRRRHVKFVHLQIKLFTCDLCGKACSDRANFKAHRAVHTQPRTSDRPYQCAECGKTFTKQGSLCTHIKSVHKNLRPHTCDHCGKSFHTRFKLKNHIQGVHFKHETPYICELCGKGFPIQGNLYWHKRVTHRPKTEEEERKEAARQAERERRAAGGKRIRNRSKKAAKKPSPSTDNELEEVGFNEFSEDCSPQQESEGIHPSTSFFVNDMIHQLLLQDLATKVSNITSSTLT